MICEVKTAQVAVELCVRECAAGKGDERDEQGVEGRVGGFFCSGRDGGGAQDFGLFVRGRQDGGQDPGCRGLGCLR